MSMNQERGYAEGARRFGHFVVGHERQRGWIGFSQAR
jgi:hypothetical protein